MTWHPGYLDQQVGTFLDELAAGTPAPAGGSAAALVIAQAAALCAKAARLSARQLTAERADQLTAQAERIRTTAASLIDEDARGYRGVIEAIRRTARPGDAAAPSGSAPNPGGQAANPGELAEALSRAAEVPMRLVELATPVAELAATLAAEGNPALHGDVLTAALLAQAGARAATALISINLAAAPHDTRPGRAVRLLAEIAGSVDRATG